MKYFIIIRGPAGVGKSTIAQELAKKLNAYYISFDQILLDNKLDIVEGDCIQVDKFIKANDIILPKVMQILENQIIIFDGCFYHLQQIHDLQSRIPAKSIVINLKASLAKCLARDASRSGNNAMGGQRIKDVYKLVSKFDCGIDIMTDGRSVEEIVKEIVLYLI